MLIKNTLKRNEHFVTLYDKLKMFYYKNLISDEKLIRKKFKKRLGREVEFEDPVDFSDKLQWLKLNWYDPLATTASDKYGVRKMVADQIGNQYLNDLLGVYESVDEIELDKLPTSFVLKGTHGSGFNLICKDKDKIDWDLEFKKMKRWLKTNYYFEKREWVYKDIKPRIICEKFLSDNKKNMALDDYKFYCFNGMPHYCQVIRGRGQRETIDFFDMQWRHMPFVGMRKLPNSNEEIKKPLKYGEMIQLAKKLSARFPFVRVDFYYVENHIYFGELTFFPTSGMGEFHPKEWNQKIGELLVLPKK